MTSEPSTLPGERTISIAIPKRYSQRSGKLSDTPFGLSRSSDPSTTIQSVSPPPTPHTATLYDDTPVHGGLAVSPAMDIFLEAMLAPGLLLCNGVGLVFRELREGTVRAIVIHDRMTTPVAVVHLDLGMPVVPGDHVRLAARTLVLDVDPRTLGGECPAPPLISPIEGWAVAPQLAVFPRIE